MKTPEHPSMQGKSNEEILADIEPFITELRNNIETDVEIFVGSKHFTVEEYYNEVTSLSPLGRELISAWYYSNDMIVEYDQKEAALKETLKKIKKSRNIWRIVFLADLGMIGIASLLQKQLGSAYVFIAIALLLLAAVAFIVTYNKNYSIDNLRTQLFI